MHTYRVWMQDGYCGLYDAETPEEAKQKAIDATKANIEGVSMTAQEKKKALTVDLVKQLN